MGKRSAVVELFLGDMGSMQRELRPSTQREDQLTMETKLEQIAVKAVNQLPKSVVREIRTPRSVGAGGGRPPPATRWDGKRGVGHRPQATAPIRDSTEADLAPVLPEARCGLENKFVEHVVLAVRRSTGCRRSHFGCGWSSQCDWILRRLAMTISHRFIEPNGITMDLAEAGSGPTVLLCHGFSA